MGAPKQKWTGEEESALKAGVRKHGAGKWCTILKDPEFRSILFLRSNVDLKDKWRNMSVTANGWGSRDRSKLALKRSQPPRHDDNPLALSTMEDSEDDIVDVNPLAVSTEMLQVVDPKKSLPRLESLIMEAITTLKEPTGSNKTAIATYIEDNYFSPPNFKRLLSMKLKELVAHAKLIKVKRKYRIVPSSWATELSGSKVLQLEGKPKGPFKVEDDVKPLVKSQIDAELLKIRSMTPAEAALAAARAVAAAEAALAEAEEAAREAEAAEADAEAAQLFADAAMTTLKNRSMGKMVTA